MTTHIGAALGVKAAKPFNPILIRVAPSMHVLAASDALALVHVDRRVHARVAAIEAIFVPSEIRLFGGLGSRREKWLGRQLQRAE
jgi:hypothetical protein